MSVLNIFQNLIVWDAWIRHFTVTVNFPHGHTKRPLPHIDTVITSFHHTQLLHSLYHISVDGVDIVCQTLWCHPLDWYSAFTPHSIVIMWINVSGETKVTHLYYHPFIQPITITPQYKIIKLIHWLSQHMLLLIDSCILMPKSTYMQFLAARSLCTISRLDKYSIPCAIWMQKLKSWIPEIS